MMEEFDAAAVWAAWRDGASGIAPAQTVFMAVPTVYSRLISAHAEMPHKLQQESSAAIHPNRNMMR
eukprot:SAG31_NODE_32031_length_361_cov_0.583969_1_plen_65_part_10